MRISISCDRIIELENLLSDVVCERFVEKDFVCPAQLRIGLFTVGAFSNIIYKAQDSCNATELKVPETTITETEGHLRGAKTEEISWTQQAIELLVKNVSERNSHQLGSI